MTMSDDALHSYLRQIEATYRQGNATEHTYRSHLKNLVETLGTGITATNEPKRVACGAPDFIITHGQTPLGYIETKDISVPLDKIERSDQMKRYLGSLSNLILTDYLDFRWYVAGQQRMSATLAKPAAKGHWQIDPESASLVSRLLNGFILAQVPTIASPKELAKRMAALVGSGIGNGQITFRDRSASIFSREYPRLPPYTASLCSPRDGAGRSNSAVAAEK